jgi:HEAT repeat protein
LYALGTRARGATAALRRRLAEDDPAVRLNAAYALTGLGEQEAVAAVPVLLRLLEEEPRSPARCEETLMILQGAPPPGKAAVPILRKLLLDKNLAAHHWRIAAILKRMGPEAAAALPDLLKLFDDDPASAAEMVAAIQPDRPDAVPHLAALLYDPEEYVRARATTALGRLGPAARAAVPRLKQALKDESNRVRFGAAHALLLITEDEAAYLPLLLDAAHEDPTAAWALSNLKSSTKGVIPALVAALDAKDGDVRAFAAFGLRSAGPDAKAAVPGLIRMLEARPRSVWQSTYRLPRGWAAEALGAIGPAAKDAVPALRALVAEGEDEDAWAAETALWKIGEGDNGSP